MICLTEWCGIWQAYYFDTFNLQPFDLDELKDLLLIEGSTGIDECTLVHTASNILCIRYVTGM
jgi:hypothetical protein